MAGLIVRREEGPKSEGVTSIVDDCDNRGGGERRKELRVHFFFFFFWSPFIFCRESACLGVDCG